MVRTVYTVGNVTMGHTICTIGNVIPSTSAHINPSITAHVIPSTFAKFILSVFTCVVLRSAHVILSEAKDLPRQSLALLVTIVVMSVLIPSSVRAEPPGVSPAQRDQLKALAAETREKIRRVREELMRARMELFQTYRSYELDERKAKAAIEKIGKSQLTLLNLHLDRQIELRRILDESQFGAFTRRMERFGGQAPGVFGPREDGPMDRLPDRETLQRIGVGEEDIRLILRDTDAAQRKVVVDKLVRDSKRLIELYSRYDLDIDTARKLINSIHESQTDLAALNHKRQQMLRDVLTRQQFERLQEEMSKSFKPRHHGRRWPKKF
ncbi:MAG: hypothetical protein N3B12_00785 [Armatimonadetes bacterium]|nr:hypothetical protein [Armatimonadota bacterium]